jgi:nicotinamidase-related amidase
MKSAVLVIDVQNGVFGKDRMPYDSNAVVERICEIVKNAKSRGNVVIYVQHEAPGIVEYGSEDWNLYHALPVEDGDVKIRKKTPDAFFNTELDQILKTEGITDLVICGYSSDFCIDRTTFKAANSGYKVALVGDAHTTHDKPHLDARQIREHHNFILSQHPAVSLVSYKEVVSG